MAFDTLPDNEKSLALRMFSFTEADKLNVNMNDEANDYLLVIRLLEVPEDACSGFSPSITMIMANIAAKASSSLHERDNCKRFHDQFMNWLWIDTIDRALSLSTTHTVQ